MNFFQRLWLAARWSFRPGPDLTPREQDERSRRIGVEVLADRLGAQVRELESKVKVQALEIHQMAEVIQRDRCRVQAEAAVFMAQQVKAERAAGEAR